jgi:succinate dehydrogenase / fumarate reductase cytochrome b subunit
LFAAKGELLHMDRGQVGRWSLLGYRILGLGIYRGQSGQWSWFLHRLSGLGILAFLLVHIIDISLLELGPTYYNDAISIFSTPGIRAASLILIAAVMYHVFNGLRIIAIDFWPSGVRYQQQMWIAAMALAILCFIGMGIFVIGPIFGFFTPGVGPLVFM